jgi:hypothetical protein
MINEKIVALKKKVANEYERYINEIVAKMDKKDIINNAFEIAQTNNINNVIDCLDEEEDDDFLPLDIEAINEMLECEDGIIAQVIDTWRYNFPNTNFFGDDEIYDLINDTFR